MSCLNGLQAQIVTFVSVPHEVLLLQHKVFREYAKVAVGPDFIHTLPSFFVLTAMAIVLWKNPPNSRWLIQKIGFTPLYKTFQISISWIAINAVLWLWLIFQRVLYCSLWTYWSYEIESRQLNYPWWHRVWSLYYPPPLQPPIFSAGFISWIISMLLAALSLGCAISTARVRQFLDESFIFLQDAISLAISSLKWTLNRLREIVMPYVTVGATDKSEESSLCDECRSEISSEVENTKRKEIHPISYGTNWTRVPTFTNLKETQRKPSMKSVHTVTGVTENRAQHNAKFSPKQTRQKRSCHTGVPSVSSEKSGSC